MPPGSRKQQPAALDAGLRLLAARSHSVAELRQKLLRRRLAAPEVDAAIARLAALGYLDDTAFARGVVTRRAGSRGRAAIAAELAQKGVSRAIAAEALAGLDGEHETRAALQLARRFERGGAPAGERLQKLAGRLQRRGFSTEAVSAVIKVLAAAK